MSDEQNDPRPYDPEEFEDDVDEVTEDDQPTGNLDDGAAHAEEDELPDELPRAMPPGSAAELDEEPDRREPDDIEP